MISEKCFDPSKEEIRKYYRENPCVTTGKEFQEALQKIGVFPGIRMVVHSSLGSLGRFEGGPENMCQILCDAVTEEGILMLPGLVKYPGDGEEYIYDPQETPTNTGIIPDTFRKRKDVFRSLDPTHSFSVWGKEKLFYVKEHHKYSSMHRKSPLGLLEQADGYCLLIGCHSVTFQHVVETSCHAGCLGARTEEYPGIIHGRKVKLRAWGWRSEPCPVFKPVELFQKMRERGAIKEVMVNYCHLMLFKLSDYRKVYEEYLLDPEKGCKKCTIPPRKVKQNVPTDLDEEKDELFPSDAFTSDAGFE